MFSQKKKRSKGWIFAALIVVLFLLGLWLNSILNGTENDSQSGGGSKAASKNAQSSNEIPIFEYNDVDDENEKNSNNKNSDDGNNKNGSNQNNNDLNSNYNNDNSYNYDYNNENGSSGNYEERTENSNNNPDSDINDNNSGSNYDNSGYDNSKGKIWVVSRGDTVVVQTYDDNGNLVYKLDTDIDISMLPEYDRKALEKGMYLKNEDELYEMLQDFEG